MLKGIYTALITPFQNNGSLDKEGLRKNLHDQLKSGIHGLTLLGTTAETPTLTQQEQEEILSIALEECQGKIPLMVGTGSNSTDKTIAQTKWAESMGADSALIVTPYYNKPTQEGIYRHYVAIAEATSLPFYLYNIPGRTGVAIQPNTLQRLAQIPTCIGIKESTGNILSVGEMRQVVDREDFAILSGDDVLLLPFLTLGGDGGISVTSNIAPEPMISATSLKHSQTGLSDHDSSSLPGAFLEANLIIVAMENLTLSLLQVLAVFLFVR